METIPIFVTVPLGGNAATSTLLLKSVAVIRSTFNKCVDFWPMKSPSHYKIVRGHLMLIAMVGEDGQKDDRYLTNWL